MTFKANRYLPEILQEMNVGVMLHHSNASSHSETITTEYLEQKKHKTRAANTRKNGLILWESQAF